MTHPAWKRSYARKAVRLRRNLTDAALSKRLSVPLGTLDTWLYGERASVPECKCGKPCAYYGEVGGYSVACVDCNAKNAKRQRDARAESRRGY